MYRCFDYGCLEPTANLSAAIQQMQLRNRLWNRFVEIERDNRAKRDAILAVPEQQDLDEAFTKLADLRQKLKAAKKKLPRQHSEDPLLDLAAQVKDVEAMLRQRAAIAGVIADGTLTEAQNTKLAIRALYGVIKEKRRELAGHRREDLKALEEERKLAANQAQRESGLYWGNYDDVRTNYETARVRAMKEGAMLRFHRWEGSGKLSVRWQTGIPTKCVLADDSRLRIAPVPEEAFTSPIRGDRRRLARTVAHIRTYNENKELVFVDLPVVLHRPLPETGIVRTASVVRERIASAFRYKLVLSVDVGTPKQRAGSGVTVTLNHLRPVASWRGDDGGSGIIELPESLIGNFHKCEELQSLIDQKFNAARTALVGWLETNRLPDALKEQAEHIAQWRSARRLWLLVRDWEKARFKGDEMIFAAVSAWRTKHQHLWEWKRNLEDQMVAARREEYRKAAAMLAKRYAVLYVTGLDLAQKKRKPEAEVDRVVVAARTRDIAAHGVLRGVLKNAFLQSGGTVEAESEPMRLAAAGD